MQMQQKDASHYIGADVFSDGVFLVDRVSLSNAKKRRTHARKASAWGTRKFKIGQSLAHPRL
jgi:hypothetical protein